MKFQEWLDDKQPELQACEDVLASDFGDNPITVKLNLEKTTQLYARCVGLLNEAKHFLSQAKAAATKEILARIKTEGIDMGANERKILIDDAVHNESFAFGDIEAKAKALYARHFALMSSLKETRGERVAG